MSRLLPKLRIHDPSLPSERQQSILAATHDAKVYARITKKNTPSSGDERFWKEATAVKEAKTRASIIVPKPSEADYMGQLVMTFGKYMHQTFRWLLENDVGYVV